MAITESSRKLIDPRYPNRVVTAHSDAVKVLFGLDPKQKWPVLGMKPRVIQGIKVWVDPLRGDAPKTGKRHTHRVMAECPDCGKVVSAGRLHQHVCK